MASGSAGGFEYRGRGYRFQQAHCTWEAGELFLDAEGERCALSLVGVPFPGASGVEELAGRAWEPDDEELSRYADTFAEGGLEVRGRRLWIMGGRVECRGYDPDRGILTVPFRFDVQEGEYGRADEVVGVAYCQVGQEDEGAG